MARRTQSFVEDLIEIARKLPWWAGGVLAVAAYFLLHGLTGSEVTADAQPGRMGEFVSQSLVQTLASVGQYLLPLVFLVGAALSAYGRHTRRGLHAEGAARPAAGAFSDMSRQQFEALVGEAFRHKGYSVTEAGGGDGGPDLTLKKAGETFLVQCKQWRAIKVGVNTLRELYGVMTARQATGGFAMTSGVFTDEARAFAQGANIELIDGKALHGLIRGVRPPVKFSRDPLSVMTTGAPFCPACQTQMVRRTAKRGANAGKEFWGCPRYPDCKGMRPI